MQRRSFLAAIAALPVFGLQKAPRDLSMWTNYPIEVTEEITPFIMVNLDNGPVTIEDITFSISNLQVISYVSGESLISHLPKWVKIDYKGSDYRHLIPLSKEDHSRSDFINEMNKTYSSLPKKFYHIKYKNTSNLWAQIGLIEGEV